MLIAKKSDKQVDLSKVAKNGKYTELAVPGEEYYLFDTAAGKTPVDAKVSREGDDLVIRCEKKDMEVVIDQFWQECSPNDQCYAIFDVPATETVEAGQVVVTQVGSDVSAFHAGMVGTLPESAAFNPMLLGLGALGLAALGAGGGGGGSSSGSGSDNAHNNGGSVAAGHAPEVVAKDGGAVTVTPAEGNDKVVINYVPENGSADALNTVTVTKKPNGTWSSDSKDPYVQVDPQTGEVTITADGVKDGSEVTVRANDQVGSAIAKVDSGDMDGDGIPDSQDADMDGDGVNNADEKLIGTDPKLPDSNGDGKSDGDDDADGDGILNKDESNPNSVSTTSKDGDNNPDIMQLPQPTVELTVKDGHQTGGVTVAPQVGTNADKVAVTYTPENANGTPSSETTITATKGPNGWTLDPVPTSDGVSIDPITGKITLDPDAVADNQPVTAKTISTDPKVKDSAPVTVTTPAEDDKDGDGIVDSQDNDRDGDGINNADEAKIGTNPDKADTNDDGTPDGEDDFDHDGIKNKDESDPNGANSTDRDGSNWPDIAEPPAPTITPSKNVDDKQTGGMQVGFNPNADKVNITYTPENGTETKIAAVKTDTGAWKFVDQNGSDIETPKGVAVVGNTVVFDPDSIKDGSDIKTTTQIGNLISKETAGIAPVDLDAQVVNDKPVIDVPDGNVIYEENSAVGKSLYKVEASDANNDKITDFKFAITGGNDEGFFAIDSQGNISLTPKGASSAANDFEAGSNHAFNIKVVAVDMNGNVSEAQTIPLEVKDVDELPAPVVTLRNDSGTAGDNVSNDGTLNIDPKVNNGAEIQSVKATKADGTVIDVPKDGNGNYVLPEGEYSQVVATTTKGGETETGDLKNVTVDRTPPAASTVTGSTVNGDGSVKVELPSSAEDGDKVVVKFTDEQGNPQEVTFTKDGSGWTSDKPTVLPNLQGNTVTIPENSVQDGSRVSATSVDKAGNASPTADALADGDEPLGISIPAIDKDGYVNNAEQKNGMQGTTTNAPDGSEIKIFKDGVEMPASAPIVVKNNQFVIPADQIQEGTGYTVKVISPYANGRQTAETPEFTVDRVAPTAPDVQPQDGGSMNVDFPADAVDGDKVKVEFVDKDGNPQEATFTKNGDAWTPDASSVLPAPSGNTLSIPADALQGGSVVTATATDKAGNSAMDIDLVRRAPASFAVAEVRDGVLSKGESDDGISGTTNNINNGQTVQLYHQTQGGFEPVTGATATVENGKFTIPSSSLTNLVADNVYVVKVDAGKDEAGNNVILSTIPFTYKPGVDNVTYKLTDNNSVVLPSDDSGAVGPFGDATDSANDKYRDTKLYNNQEVRIHNPKLDWLMRKFDDSDDTNGEPQYEYDHANGWSRSDGTTPWDGLLYKWNGADNKGDVIIAAKVRTDDNTGAGGYFGEPYRQGLIGAEDTGTSWFADINQVPRFILDTQGGGADFIQSEGIVGNVKITTRDGNDTIITQYLRGKYQVGSPNFNGSQQIDMGDGDDKFIVTGTAKSAGLDWDINYNDSSFSETNAKVWMGAGNDTVEIAYKIIADSEDRSGNYFDLGSGNDQMTIATIADNGDQDWKASNIINLGVGENAKNDFDKLTVNGSITSDGAWGGRFLLTSDGSSEVTIADKLDIRGGMLMGDGDDKITVKGLVDLNTNDTRKGFAWVDDVFENAANYFADGNTTDELKSWHSGTTFYDQDLRNKVSGELGDPNDDESRIDLGNGNNTFDAMGGMIYSNVVGGNGADKVTVGIDPEYEWSVSYGVQFHHTNIDTGAGDDNVEVTNVGQAVHINTGAGDDIIHTHNIFGTDVKIYAGAGNDTIHLADTVYGISGNIVDGGDGHDTLLLGNESKYGVHNAVVLGGDESGYTRVTGVEEIKFMATDNLSGDIVRIEGNDFSSASAPLGIGGYDTYSLKIRGSGVVDKTTGNGFDTVELDSRWQYASDSISGLDQGITYNVYRYNGATDTPVLLIDNHINIVTY